MKILTAILWASCLFVNKCQGGELNEIAANQEYIRSLEDLEIIPPNPIEQPRSLFFGTETRDEILAKELEAQRIEEARKTDRKERIMEIAGCTMPDGTYREPGELYFRKCLFQLCFDGKEFSSDIRDETCCSTENQNAWYETGSTFTQNCWVYNCTNGVIMDIEKPVLECCYGADHKWHSDGEVYRVNCMEFICDRGFCLKTNREVEDCCDGEFGPRRNGQTFIDDCQMYTCVDGDYQEIDTVIPACCVNEETGEGVEDGEVFHQYCIEYICLQGVSNLTGDKISHCCVDVDGNYYGDSVTYIRDCQAFTCSNGSLLLINASVVECCASSDDEWYTNGTIYADQCIDYMCVEGVSFSIDEPGYRAKNCCLDDYGNWHRNWERYLVGCTMYECIDGFGIPLENKIDHCCLTTYNMWFKHGEEFSDCCRDYICDNGEPQLVNYPSDKCCIDAMMNWHRNYITYTLDCKIYKCKDGMSMFQDVVENCGAEDALLRGL